MFEQDYLMRILLQYAEILRRSWFTAKEDRDPKRAADMLEDAVGEATDLDGNVLLSLSPDSIASVLQVSGVDPNVVEYVARSLMLASTYLDEAGDTALSQVRMGQARALAHAYNLDLPEDPAALAGMAEAGFAEYVAEHGGAEPAIIDIEGPHEVEDTPAVALPLEDGNDPHVNE